MNNRQGSFLALFFAVCFLALQFHGVADTQFEQSDNQTFQVQVVGDSLIDYSFDNSAIYTQSVCLSQSLFAPEQSQQFIRKYGQQSHNPFHAFMRQNLAAICQIYQHKLAIAFHNQQLIDLSFESNPLLTSIHRKQPAEESDQPIS